MRPPPLLIPYPSRPQRGASSALKSDSHLPTVPTAAHLDAIAHFCPALVPHRRAIFQQAMPTLRVTGSIRNGQLYTRPIPKPSVHEVNRPDSGSNIHIISTNHISEALFYRIGAPTPTSEPVQTLYTSSTINIGTSNLRTLLSTAAKFMLSHRTDLPQLNAYTFRSKRDSTP